MPAADDRISKAADNALLRLVARYSMALTLPVLAVVGFLARSYVNDFDHRLVVAQSTADTAVLAVADLRSQQALTAQTLAQTTAAWSAWQASVNNRLDKITDALNGLSVSVAGLNATVQQINR